MAAWATKIFKLRMGFHARTGTLVRLSYSDQVRPRVDAFKEPARHRCLRQLARSGECRNPLKSGVLGGGGGGHALDMTAWTAFGLIR